MFKRIVGTIWRTIPRFLRLKIIRLTQTKFTVSVAAVIFDAEGKVLLLDHVLRPGSGWGIPGGFVNRGEQPAVAIEREIHEETGLRLENIKLFRARIINKHVEFIFQAQAKGAGEVKSREILAVEWFALDEMPEEMSAMQKVTVREVLNCRKTKS